MPYQVKRVKLQPGVKSDQADLDEILQEGWDPFSVTWDGHVWDVWLKKLGEEE